MDAPFHLFSMTVSGEVKPSGLSSSYSGPVRALLNSLAKLQAREVHTVRTSVIAAGLVAGDAIFHTRPHGKRKTAARITESEYDGSRVTVGVGDTEWRRSEPAPLFFPGPSSPASLKIFTLWN
jgi:hypothetical protein